MASCSRCLPTQPSDRAGWQAELANSVSSSAEVCRLLGLAPAFAAEARESTGQFSLLIPRPFMARIRPGDPADPLLLQVMPQAAETATIAGYGCDPLGEAALHCGPGLLRKYQGRVLMVATRRCAVHCRYCFRRHFLGPAAAETGAMAERAPRPPQCHGGAFEDATEQDEWSAALRQISANSSIREVILSGGDPFVLDDNRLGRLAERLADIPHIGRLRIHTRMPIMVPERVTDELMAWLGRGRLSTIVVLQVNNAAEIDQAVADAIGRLSDCGCTAVESVRAVEGRERQRRCAH